jgi:hypothetical protein
LGLDPKAFSGHSLRAGSSPALPRGASLFKLADVSRHKSMDTLRGYVWDAEVFKNILGTLGKEKNADFTGATVIPSAAGVRETPSWQAFCSRAQPTPPQQWKDNKRETGCGLVLPGFARDFSSEGVMICRGQGAQ